MSTDLTTYEGHALATTDDPTGGRLIAWSQAARSAAALGTSLSQTSFVPAVFRGKPEECAAAILYGDEIGLTPMQALQSVYVVSGRPGLYSRAMLAIALAAGHEVKVTVKTDEKVTVEGRRKGSQHWESETWTTARAQKAGYTSNKKYVTDPQAMLLARATADICRRVAPDALAGLTVTVEELELEDSAPVAVTVTRSESKPTRVQRAKAPEPVAPPLDDIVDADIVEPEPVVVDHSPKVYVPEPREPQAAPNADGITGPQTKMMGALMRELGITEREDAITYCNDVIGREIASRSELTKHEAMQVLDSLNRDRDAQTPQGEA